MIKKLSLTVLFALFLPVSAHAQNAEGSGLFQIRAVLHDPVNPVADLFLTDQSGGIVKLNLTPSSLSQPQMARPLNGSLVFYSTAAIDPKNPQASVAATIKIPENTRRAIVVVLPSAPNSSPKYRMVIIDDSAAGFPKGESRVLSLVPVDTAVEAGEHKLPVNPGKVTSVPAVRKVNEFNMAQTNFYYKEGTSWVAFTERQLQYLDEFRRLFIVHVTPGSTQPFVTTIVDTTAAATPAQP